MKSFLATTLCVCGLFAACNESDHIWVNILGLSAFTLGGYLLAKWKREAEEQEYLNELNADNDDSANK